MSNLFRRGSAAIMAAVIALSLAGCNKDEKPENDSNGPPPSDILFPINESTDSVSAIKNGSILHTWSWSFKTITESIPDIAYAGYTAIQTSPINECLVGDNGGMQLYGEGKWYYYYQPTDWTIGNYMLGTKEEFTEMCAKAHEYGIRVIVDVIPNHTTPQTDKVNANFINAVGGMENLYHENGFNEIGNYSDRRETTTGQMGGLPDVNTENPDFQDYFIKYLNECIACGADGFRYDTAKHIGLPDDPIDPKSEKNNFWERVINEIDNAENIFNYGEILQDGGDRIGAYQEAIGATTASDYGHRLRSAVSSGNLNASELTDLLIDYENPTAVTWVESHDNFCNDGSINQLNEDQVILAWAIICARANGTPLFFDRPYGSSTSNMWGDMNRIGAAGDPYYKDSRVVAVNRFRNAMVGESEKFSNPGGNTGVLMIERGTKGAVLVNAGSSSVNISSATDLADGEYVSRINSTNTFTVQNGTITGTIAAGEIVVLYNEGYTEITAIPTVKAEAESFILTSKEASVKLSAENADESTYSINGGTPVSYANGDVIDVIGSSSSNESLITLTLHAKNSGGETTMTYYFTVQANRSVEAGTKVFFNKPDDWGDSVNIYVYDERNGSVSEAASWPGVACVKESDGSYSYTFDKDWDNVLIIFNDGSKQLPGSLEPGWEVVPGGIYPM